MSKKYKIKKKVPVPDRPSENIPASVPGPRKPSSNSSAFLILFDKKTKIFLYGTLIFYIILSTLKIHTSNIANWDMFFGLEKSESVIAGTPRFIRMDEWMINATGQIGQYNAGLPVQNATMGDANAPVVWNLPVKDVSTLFRPYLWSYFVFDVERAFAFSWNFNTFGFIISMFLLLMLLTRNNFWLSITGTFFIFLSGGIQWWSYFISNHMLYLNGMFISFIYLLYDKRKWPLIISGLIFILSVNGFIFNLYPAFQVPLVYLYLLLFIGFILQRKAFTSIKENIRLKAIVFSVVLVILAIFIYHYYSLVKDTYSMMLNTVYPGRRFSSGGDLANGKLFAEFFGIFMWDLHVPKQWLNICEASGAIMFFPIIFYAMGYYFFKTRKTDPVLITLSIFLIITLLYVLVGFPAFLSKITLFSMSPSYRMLPIIGVGNCFLLISFLGSNKTYLKNEKFSWIEFAIIAVSSFIFIRMVASHINQSTENFFTGTEVNIVTAIVVAAYLLIRYKEFPYTKIALYLLLAGISMTNLKVNPLTKGLAPVLENPLYQAGMELHKQDPQARWALFGNMRLTHLLKAAGIDVFNTVKFVPPMKDMKVLDPFRKNDSVYNRYAWITMDSKQLSQYYYGAGWNDTVMFRQAYEDGYAIYMDACSPKLKQLGVKYFVFDYAPKDEEVRCMIKLKETAGLFIYKRKDE